METAMNRLATGQRINSAADDAAGVAISSRMTAQINGLNQAIRNAGDGQSMASTAEGAMQEIESMLQRMRELSVQAQNGTLSVNDRENLDDEVTQLRAEIDRIANSTEFNGVKLLNGTADVNLQIGASADNTLNFKVGSLSTTALGTSLTSGAVTASTSVVSQGSSAVENVVNMTLNGNDTYGFKIEFDGDTTNKTLTFASKVMTLNDASSIAADIQTAIDGDADTKGLATATASGNTITLTAKDGAQVKIHDFTSTGGGSMTVNPITNTASNSVVLEDTSEVAQLANTGGTQATASTSALELETGKAYSFKVNGTLVEVATSDDDATEAGVIGAKIKSAIEATSGGTATVTSSVSGSKMFFDISDDSGNKIELTAFQKITSSAVPAGFLTIDLDTGTASTPIVVENGEFITSDQATGTGLAIATGKTGTVSFSNQNLAYTFQATFDGTNDVTYSIDGKTKDFMTELTRVAAEITAEGTGIAAVNNSGVLEISNTTGSNISFKGNAAITAPAIAAVDEGNAFFLADALPNGDTDLSDNAGVVTLADGSTGSSTDGVLAVASEMFLSFSATDRYTFTIDGDGSGTDANKRKVIVGDVTNNDLDGIVNTVNAQSSSTGVQARAQDGQLVLSKADGTAFSIDTFSSEGTGKVTAVNAGGQGSSAVLEGAGDGDEVVVGTGGSNVAKKAVASTMVLTPSGADKFSFKISDGSSTAVVRATSTIVSGGTSATTIDDADDVADLKAEIARALTAANMDHITVDTATDDDGTLTLSNSLGTKIEITDFRSDGSETMTATPGSGQGVGTILDDNALNAAQAAVSSIDISTVTGAASAMATVDRALETLGQERANLGAVVNRLDYTISNLTNVSAETSAARGRIQDADFASETSTLAKSQILQQASMAMLAQANATKQNVLSLLQG